MAKAPAFQFYPSDFLTGTANFRPEERGAYITLLCIQWANGGIDYADFEYLSGLPMDKLKRVLMKFEKCHDGLYRNARLEETREKQSEFSKKQQVKAKRRWNNAETMPKDMPNECRNDAALGNAYIEDRRMKIEDKEEIRKESKIQKNETPLVFPFESEKFMAAWNVLRNEKKWRNKSQAALQASLKQLSAFDEDFAIELMEKAISGNYQGVVFANTKSDYQKIKGNGKRTDKDGNTILAGRITEIGAASLLAAAELYERGKNNADGDIGAKVH